MLELLEAIFVVMGRPEESWRQCPLALDKWMDLTVGHEVTLLGLFFILRNMTVGMTRDYLDEAIAIIDASWHNYRNPLPSMKLRCWLGSLGYWVRELLGYIT